MNLYFINGTDYVTGKSQEEATETFLKEAVNRSDGVEEIVVVPDTRRIYIFLDPTFQREVWSFGLHQGWTLVKETSVGEYIPSYCRQESMIVWSTEW